MTQVLQHTLASSRTTIETDNKPVTKTFKVGKPIAYTASEGVYVDGNLFKAGDVFVTAMPKGSTWEEVDPKDRAAAEATSQIKSDINFDEMDVAALKAFAATKSINLGDATKKADIISAIKAADEPTL